MLTPVLSTQTFDLYRAEQVRELDRRTIEGHGIAGYTLMCRAGQAAFSALKIRWPMSKTRSQRLTVVCGAGNNGGDGYVLARLAHTQGLSVKVLSLKDPATLIGDAATAWREAVDTGVCVQPFSLDVLADAELIIDAILGTGLQRAVSGDWARAIQAINDLSAPKLALDIPSGLHADTGAVMGCAVNAAMTVTFIGIKQGLLTGSGPAYCGPLFYDHLDVPKAVFERLTPASRHYGGADIGYALAPRKQDAHKGRYGHVLVIGGELGMAGAARMAAEAAARCGAGLVSIATRPEHAALQAAARPELMFHGVENATQLPPLLERASVLAIGPGLGTRDWGRALLDCALEHATCHQKPVVLDADGLNLLAEQPFRSKCWVLTPHPGEAARLLNTDTASVQADRFQAVQTLQQHYGGVAVLKGAGSLIADGKDIRVCSAGNPGMATGGMGDVLTGVIASLLGQGRSLHQAASLGVFIHARAGDLAACDGGERGLLASDLLPRLRRLVNPGL